MFLQHIYCCNFVIGEVYKEIHVIIFYISKPKYCFTAWTANCQQCPSDWKVETGWKLLKLVESCWNWLKVVEIGWKLLKFVETCWNWLHIVQLLPRGQYTWALLKSVLVKLFLHYTQMVLKHDRKEQTRPIPSLIALPVIRTTATASMPINRNIDSDDGRKQTCFGDLEFVPKTTLSWSAFSDCATL